MLCAVCEVYFVLTFTCWIMFGAMSIKCEGVQVRCLHFMSHFIPACQAKPHTSVWRGIVWVTWGGWSGGYSHRTACCTLNQLASRAVPTMLPKPAVGKQWDVPVQCECTNVWGLSALGCWQFCTSLFSVANRNADNATALCLGAWQQDSVCEHAEFADWIQLCSYVICVGHGFCL